MQLLEGDKDKVLKRFAFDVNHLNRFSSCFDALFDPKTVSHFSESALGAFEKIKADKRHHTKVLLEQGEIAQRNFPDWSMGFRNVNTSDLEKFQGYSDLGSEAF